MAFLGLAGSGSADLGTAESKKQFAQLMKQDKSQCEHFEKRDSLLEDLKVMRGSKKKSKRFMESQKHKDQFGQKVQLCGSNRNISYFLEHYQSYGILVFLNQLRHAYTIGLILSALIAPMAISNYYSNYYSNSN